MDVKDRTPDCYGPTERVYREYYEKVNKCLSILNSLGVQINETEMHIFDLCDLLMNEEKLKIIIAKLRNKALW